MKDIWDIKERQRTELTSDDDHVSFETFCFYALLALQQLRQRRNRQLSLYRGLIKEELFFFSVAATEFVKEGKGSFRFADTGLIKEGVFFCCCCCCFVCFVFVFLLAVQQLTCQRITTQSSYLLAGASKSMV